MPGHWLLLFNSSACALATSWRYSCRIASSAPLAFQAVLLCGAVLVPIVQIYGVSVSASGAARPLAMCDLLPDG
ncbi:hypothetical protein AWC32_00555 [Mycobacterium xenopi]|nr:hypothetical protein I552_2291 [Mycobacterium xenopi 3993]ORX22171.1 hypothetical protein AWC32_00555 [Mycobacterium xenopi]